MKYGLGGNFDFGNAMGESAAKKKMALNASNANAVGGALGAGSQMAQQANGGAPSAASGALTGASAGMALGPWGAAAGAVVGGVSGGLAAKSAKKKADAQADADMYTKQSQIEGQTALRRSAAIQSLAQNIGNTLLR